MNLSNIDDLLIGMPLLAPLQAARGEVGVSAWLVGGCVRDLLLGRPPVDLDIASPCAHDFARCFAAHTGGTLVRLDEDRAVWRVVVRGQPEVDFCGLRNADIIGDLRGRDFTFNALAVRLPEPDHAGRLFDPFHGLDDLNARLLRMVAPGAFRDDPARILRAFRFQAELNFTIDGPTSMAMEIEAPRLTQAAPERLLAEWWKLCGGPHAAPAIARMDEADVLRSFLPELAPLKGTPQNRYHHLDVWEHSLLTMTLMIHQLRAPEEVFQDLLPWFAPLLASPHRRARLVMLALLHDIGKPATQSVRDGVIHFYGHEQTGAELAGALARRLRMSNDDKRALVSGILHHERPTLLLAGVRRKPIARKSLAKFLDAVGDHLLEVLALALADKAAAHGPAADPEVTDHLRELYRQIFTYYEQVYLPAAESPLLTSADLLQALGLPPGPRIGVLLRRARDLQLEGRLDTRASALHWAKEQIRHSPL